MLTFQRTTRSGKVYEPIQCVASAGFDALLQKLVDLELLCLDEESLRGTKRKPPGDEEEQWPSVEVKSIEPRTRVISRSNRKRLEKRKAKFEAEGRSVDPEVSKKYLALSNAVETESNVEKLGATACGYMGKGMQLDSEEGAYCKCTVEELLADGFSLVEWDGSSTRPLVDSAGRVIGGLIGCPADPTYLTACKDLYTAMVVEASKATFTDKEKHHIRGDFPAINMGVTHGKGTVEPINLSLGNHKDMVERLLDNTDLQRIAAFGDYGFKLIAPKVHQYYQSHLGKLWKKRPCLRKIFKKSVYPCCAFNLGPRVWTFRHRDTKNLPFGLCSIHALGCFNHKVGGHLVLDDLKLIIEFPPGSLILIPSATLTHSNIPVAADEARLSFTQFAAGGLFRYVDNEFSTEKELKRRNPKRFREILQEKTTRWQMGINLFSKLDDLLDAQ